MADGPVADGPVADGPVADGSVADGSVADGSVGQPPDRARAALDAREARWAKRLSAARSLPPGWSYFSLTLRIPAALRLGGACDAALDEAARLLAGAARAAGAAVAGGERRAGADGPEAYLAAALEPRAAKELALSIEGGSPRGELVDIDVMDREGRALGRADLGLAPRACLVCGGPAAACVAGRAHRPDDVEAAVAAAFARAAGAGRDGPLPGP